jgi:hypothetical protein
LRLCVETYYIILTFFIGRETSWVAVEVVLVQDEELVGELHNKSFTDSPYPKRHTSNIIP